MKPVPKPHKPVYEYSECEKYISEKLGYPLRDTLGKFAGNGVADVEYRDWWHFLTDHVDVRNPSLIRIRPHLLEVGKPWENEITQAFLDEFGEDAIYKVEW